jgi:hypothetical protein
MSNYHSLPSIYLGANQEALEFQKIVIEAQKENAERFPSLNKFMVHCLGFALEHDKSLK